MKGEDFRILLALEPSWTVSINGKEFLTLPSREIHLEDSVLRFSRFTRKVVDITALKTNVVRVRAKPRLRSQTDVLVFYAGERLPDAAELRRRRTAFQWTLAGVLSRHFGRRITRQTLYSDKRHGIGGAYPRFLIGRSDAVIAVDPDEAAPVINGIMRAAIQWAQTVKRRICVVIPAERCQTILTRLQAIPVLLRCFEWLTWDGECLSPLPENPEAPETFVHPYIRPNVDREVERILALAPDLLQAIPQIAGPAVSIRLRGLEIARVRESGTAYPLGERLESVIAQLSAQRCHGSGHPLANAHQESWLESNLIWKIQEVLPVRPEFIYPQVPSFGVGERKIIDLLTVTMNGRLVVIEVKAAPDPDLPFQAFDYWMAVERHRKAGDFVANGYFRDMEILDEPALLVLVAPLLSFHRSLNRLVAMLPESVPLLQIGVSQSWKKGIKVLRRSGPLG